MELWRLDILGGPVFVGTASGELRCRAKRDRHE
jgi:hypothetical protein